MGISSTSRQFAKYGIMLAGVAILLVILALRLPLNLLSFAVHFGPEVILVLIMFAVGVALNVYEHLTGRISGAKTRSSHASFDAYGEAPVGAFEVVEYPEVYSREEVAMNHFPISEPFRNIVRGAAISSLPLSLRLERTGGQTRACFTTLASDKNTLARQMSILESLLTSNLPQFAFYRHDSFRGPLMIPSTTGAVAQLSGEPLGIEDGRQRSDPLTVVAKQFQFMENGILQINAMPASSGLRRSLKRAWKTRQYKVRLGQSMVTQSSKSTGLFGRGEESTTQIDLNQADDANRLYRELQRVKAKHACQVLVNAACWGPDSSANEQNARLLMEVLKSTLVPADPTKDFRIRVSRNQRSLRKIINGHNVGRPTLLTPEEATIFFSLPRSDIGIAISKRESFSTATTPIPTAQPLDLEMPPTSKSQTSGSPPMQTYSKWIDQRDDAIILGNTIGINGMPMARSLAWFHPQKLEAHCGIYGNVRSGKTTTALSLVAQASKCGLRTTILVPRRSFDWTRLLYLNPDLWMFTAGDPDTAPLRINIFRPPEGVSLSKWMKVLVAMLSAWLPNDRVMSMHFDDIIHTVYRKCGWVPKGNIHGRPILLNDLWNAVEEACADFQYADELKQNFYGALYGRMASMVRNHAVVDMFNTTEGITFKELARNDVIIDMEGLPDSDRALLMGILAAGLHTYKMANPTRKVTNLLVLEEASYILRKPVGVNDHYGPDASQMAIDRLLDIFTTGGGNGLGVILIEQLPGRLVPDAVKLVVNVIAHAIADEDERKTVGGHIGVQDDRLGHLRQMRKGETVVHLEGESVPKNVQILPLDKLLNTPLPSLTVTKDIIREAMIPVYERHQNLSSTEDLSQEIHSRIARAKPVEPRATDQAHHSMHRSQEISDLNEFERALDRKLKAFVEEPRYVKNLAICTESAKIGDLLPLLKMIGNISEELAYDDVTESWIAERLVIHSGELYPTLLDNDLVDTALIAIRERAR